MTASCHSRCFATKLMLDGEEVAGLIVTSSDPEAMERRILPAMRAAGAVYSHPDLDRPDIPLLDGIRVEDADGGMVILGTTEVGLWESRVPITEAGSPEHAEAFRVWKALADKEILLLVSAIEHPDPADLMPVVEAESTLCGFVERTRAEVPREQQRPEKLYGTRQSPHAQMGRRMLALILEQIEIHDSDYLARWPMVWEALSVAARLGYPCGVSVDPDAPGWPVVFIELPDAGQVSWHTPGYQRPYDGHSTGEKYARCRAYTRAHL